MTMRKNPYQTEIIAPLKYLKKPTKKIIPPLLLKVGSMQIQIFVSQLRNAWKQILLIKPYSSLVIRLKFCLEVEKDLLLDCKILFTSRKRQKA